MGYEVLARELLSELIADGENLRKQSLGALGAADAFLAKTRRAAGLMDGHDSEVAELFERWRDFARSESVGKDEDKLDEVGAGVAESSGAASDVSGDRVVGPNGGGTADRASGLLAWVTSEGDEGPRCGQENCGHEWILGRVSHRDAAIFYAQQNDGLVEPRLVGVASWCARFRRAESPKSAYSSIRKELTNSDEFELVAPGVFRWNGYEEWLSRTEAAVEVAAD